MTLLISISNFRQMDMCVKVLNLELDRLYDFNELVEIIHFDVALQLDLIRDFLQLRQI